MSPPGPIDRVFGAIVPRAVDAIDIEGVVSQVDVNQLVSEVDVDALVGRVDIQALIQRVDLDQVLTGVDLDALIGRLDVDALISRLDVDALIQRVDVDALIQRVDVDALVQRVDVGALVGRVDLDTLIQQVEIDDLISRVDVDALVKRAHIDTIVSNASRGVFARLIDAVRRQLVGLDILLIGVVSRMFRRPRVQASIIDGTVTGQIAGGTSRLAAYLVDIGVISVAYSLTVTLLAFLAGLFLGEPTGETHRGGLFLGGYGVFAFFYYWIGLSITGRSVGKGLVGLRVVAADGEPISAWRAAVRCFIYPFSFILGLGLIPIVTGKRRRALHDAVAGDLVLYDWGDRPAELPAPITEWVRRHTDTEAKPDDQPVVGLAAVPDEPRAAS